MMQRNSKEGKEAPAQGHTALNQQCHTHSWSPTFKDNMIFSYKHTAVASNYRIMTNFAVYHGLTKSKELH